MNLFIRLRVLKHRCLHLTGSMLDVPFGPSLRSTNASNDTARANRVARAYDLLLRSQWLMRSFPGKGLKQALNKKESPLCFDVVTTSGKGHLMKKCGSASAQENKESLEVLRKQKAVGKVKRVCSFLTQSDVAEGDWKSWILARLTDLVPVWVYSGYGTDHADNLERHMKSLSDHGAYVSVLLLKKPVRMELTVRDDNDECSKICSDRKARIFTLFLMPKGPSTLSNVDSMAWKQAMKDVLLSRQII